MNFKGLDAGAGDGGSHCSRKRWGWGWLSRHSTLAVVVTTVIVSVEAGDVDRCRR